MRRPAAFGVALIAAGALGVGCGGGEAGPPARPAEPPPPSDGAWSSIPWGLVGVDGQDVTVRYEGEACVVGKAGDVPVRAVAAEGRSVVTVAVYVPASNPCAGVELAGTATVRLREPLGDRRLAHATVDR